MGKIRQETTERASEGRLLLERAEVRRQLLVVGDAGSYTFVLPSSGDVTVGRAEECELQVDDPKLSRRHAIIRIGEGVDVVDLGSSNGTRVGAARLAPELPTPLAVGESVTLGSTLLVLRDGLASARRDVPAVDAGVLAEMTPALRRIAAGDINVLVVGETGVGKEIVARKIHELSPRRASPLVAVNCAALSESLLESELFGYERGAFTGAVQSKPGLFEAAEAGTLFLDEIGEMPLALQAKLLRVLEQREVLRVGARKPRPIDARFIAATNKDLAAEAARGAFRADLFFRVDGITVTIPPLRERRDEIEPLARGFAAAASARGGRAAVPKLSQEAVLALTRYPWPGNIRQLKNVVERVVLLCDGDVIAREDVEAHLPAASAPPGAGDDERARIVDALAQAAGNQTKAAKLLGISLRTLVTRIEQHGIPRPRKP